MSDRYIDWVYRNVSDRPMRADEAEALLRQQARCLAIASAAAGLFMGPAIGVSLTALGGNPPSGIVSVILIIGTALLAASLGIWRFSASIVFIVKHIEHYSLAPRPGWVAVESRYDGDAGVDPLHKAMGLEGAD